MSPARFVNSANRTFTVRMGTAVLNGAGVPGASFGAYNQDYALFVVNGSLTPLLDIPIEPRFRHTLRMYALPDVEVREVEVRYFRQPDVSGPRIDFNMSITNNENQQVTRRRIRRSVHPPPYQSGGSRPPPTSPPHS